MMTAYHLCEPLPLDRVLRHHDPEPMAPELQQVENVS
jgi:hypothetical protein